MSIEVYPVVHVSEVAQATEQAAVAFEAGADGIYLIDHKNHYIDTLLDAFGAVTEEQPDGFVGLNFLQLCSGREAFSTILERHQLGDIAALPRGIWVDDADHEKPQLEWLRCSSAELLRIRYLGGVAFKYTAWFTDDPEQAAYEARRLEPFVDVVTTSGKGTGMAPSPEKIRAMKKVIGDKKLAVASGISLENLADYGGNFDQLLVSTSVETEPYSGVFVPGRLKELIDLTHE